MCSLIGNYFLLQRARLLLCLVQLATWVGLIEVAPQKLATCPDLGMKSLLWLFDKPLSPGSINL